MAFQQKSDPDPLTIESLSNDGSGVAHHGRPGRFCPQHAAPGDVAEVRIVKPMKGYAFGKLEKLAWPPAPAASQQDCPVAGALRRLRPAAY